jgi:hypothetical protein
MTEVTMYKRPTYQELKAKTGRMQTGALIDTDLLAQLRMQAAAENRTLGALIDDAVRLYLKKRAKP